MIRHFCDRCDQETPKDGDRHNVSIEGDGKNSFGAFVLCSFCLNELELFFKPPKAMNARKR